LTHKVLQTWKLLVFYTEHYEALGKLLEELSLIENLHEDLAPDTVHELYLLPHLCNDGA
jgi:hypothetical protein